MVVLEFFEEPPWDPLLCSREKTLSSITFRANKVHVPNRASEQEGLRDHPCPEWKEESKGTRTPDGRTRSGHHVLTPARTLSVPAFVFYYCHDKLSQT